MKRMTKQNKKYFEYLKNYFWEFILQTFLLEKSTLSSVKRIQNYEA